MTNKKFFRNMAACSILGFLFLVLGFEIAAGIVFGMIFLSTVAHLALSRKK